jgi:tetratricopeptide (TPR) repeat protein
MSEQMDVKLNPKLFDVVALRDESAPEAAVTGTVVEIVGNGSLLVEVADEHGVGKEIVTLSAEGAKVVWPATDAPFKGPETPNSRQLFEEGILLLQNGLLDQGKKFFAESFKLEPKLAGTLMNLANQLAEKSAFESAMLIYQLIDELQPRYSLARENLAITHLNRGTYFARLGAMDKAIEDYNICLWLHPSEQIVQLSQRNIVAAFTRLGITHIEIKRYEEAVTYFVAACQLWPFEDTRKNLGLALASIFATRYEGHGIPSKQNFKQAMLMGLTLSECLNAFGATLTSLGRIVDGRNAIRAALETDPHNERARKNLDILSGGEVSSDLSSAMWGLESVEPAPTRIAVQ